MSGTAGADPYMLVVGLWFAMHDRPPGASEPHPATLSADCNSSYNGVAGKTLTLVYEMHVTMAVALSVGVCVLGEPSRPTHL